MGGVKLTLNILCYASMFLLWNKIGTHNDIFIKMLKYVQPIIMGIYGSLIMVQVSKKLGNLPLLVTNKIYRTFSRNSYELYLFSDPFNYAIIYLLYTGMGEQILTNTGSALSFFVRFFGTIVLAFGVIGIKNKTITMISHHGTISKS